LLREVRCWTQPKPWHEWVSRDRFRAMIRERTITDDSTVAAFALLLLHENSATDR
jgi:hypothetical protein